MMTTGCPWLSLGVEVHLSRIKVSGLRASAEGELVCELPGQFNVLIGANGAGKTTIADALYLTHPSRFPAFPRQSSSALGAEEGLGRSGSPCSQG